jgi:dihydrofolate reductase
MRRLTVFNSVSIDGYFTDANNDMSWAKADDPEFAEFVAGNAKGGGTLLFGRVTFEMMRSFWPTPHARAAFPEVAKGMNALPKVVFSKSLAKADWKNTTVVKTDPVAAVKKMKREAGTDMVILGSGKLVATLADAGLLDEIQLVVIPIVLGSGRTPFEGVKRRIALTLVKERRFANGNVLVCYEPDAAPGAKRTKTTAATRRRSGA